LTFLINNYHFIKQLAPNQFHLIST